MPAVERVVAEIADVRQPVRSVGSALDGRLSAFYDFRLALGREPLSRLLLCF